MGSTPWPSSLKPLVDGYEPDDVEDVTTQKARDLSELRIHNGTGWGVSFVLRVTAAQRTTLRNFWAARKGSWDSFPFTAPDDGVQRQVKFEGNRLRGRRLGPDLWEYQIDLTTVGV
jgi:hypothetical protein